MIISFRLCTVMFALSLGATCQAASFADKRGSPAKGTKQCRIVQFSSKFLETQGAAVQRSYPRPVVLKNGSVQMGFAENTTPGTKIYYRIGGHRYSGESRYAVALDAAGVDALRKDSLIEYTFTRWPYRNEIDGEDILEGFGRAYQECLEFLRTKDGPSTR